METQTSLTVRMPNSLRSKVLRLAEEEGRMISESEMIRLLISRAPEPVRRRPRRSRSMETHAAA